MPGAPSIISGEVIHGEKRGRALGFPTANVRIPANVQIPEFGIYYGLVNDLPAAISVGVRPTFGTGLEPLIEAHLLDFSGDLYGQTVQSPICWEGGPVLPGSVG